MPNSCLPQRVLTLLISATLTGCGLMGYEPGTTSANAPPDNPLAVSARQLLETDRAFAAKSLELGATAAFQQFMDEQAVQLPIMGAPVVGRDAIGARMTAGPSLLLTWEPAYAEVLAPGDWGWTWGEWQSHEPGAGGKRLAQGKYVSLWKKQLDGVWKVRLEMESAEKQP